jgi:hypothetical protein
MNVPLVEECLDLMGCEPNCSTRLSEAVLMEDVINHILAKATEAVQVLEPLLAEGKNQGGYDCCSCSTPEKLYEDVIITIKGVGHD